MRSRPGRAGARARRGSGWPSWPSACWRTWRGSPGRPATPRRTRSPAPGSAPGGGNPTLVVEHPLGEALARALGNHDTPAARAALASFLQDEGQAPAARAAAAAALGQSASPEAKAALREGLAAREGWVRYACARALRHQGSALETFCDWVYGSEAELQAARAQLAGK